MVKKRKGPWTLTPQDYLSRDEIKALMKHCSEKADLDLIKGRTTWPIRYMLIDLALHTGMRVGEMAAFKIGDVVLNGDNPYLIVKHGKGDKKRTIYFDLELRKHLKAYIDYKRKTLKQDVGSDAPLFTGRDGQHSPPITLMKSFKTAIKDAGLRNKLSIHACRHSYATYLLHDTGNLRYVQKQLGHASIAMTSVYADILPEENGRLAQMLKREY